MLKKSFNTAQEVFEYLYDWIMRYGEDRNDTKAIYNVGVEILDPTKNIIETPWRKWNHNYAEYEWQWYLSENPNAVEISNKAKIWSNMMDENGNVNSNYGFQWNRGNQLNKIIEMMKKDPYTRRASISLYDGKEIDKYKKDTVCTYAVNFYLSSNKLHMQVLMRSNDLFYGFCNDQYCFSKLQMLVANELKVEIGTYFHFTCNMHIYQKHFKFYENKTGHRGQW